MNEVIEVEQRLSAKLQSKNLVSLMLNRVNGAFIGVCLFFPAYVAFNQVFQFPPVQRQIR